jgi:hypothetical protein
MSRKVKRLLCGEANAAIEKKTIREVLTSRITAHFITLLQSGGLLVGTRPTSPFLLRGFFSISLR